MRKMNEDLEAYYGLPNKVQFCKKCVISNQRPNSTVEFKNQKGDKKQSINFNADGLCSACVFHVEKENRINKGRINFQLSPPKCFINISSSFFISLVYCSNL